MSRRGRSARGAGPWRPSDEDRRLAASLGPGAAFVPLSDRHGGGVAAVRGVPAVDLPVSALLALAMAAWQAFPGQAHAVLRRRVRLTDPVHRRDRDVCAIVAKRVSAVPPSEGPVDDAPLPPILDLGSAAREAWAQAIGGGGATTGFVRCARDLARFVEACVPAPEDLPRAARARPVAAVLVDPGGAVVWRARNVGGGNRVLHAELALAASWGAHRGPIPAGWCVATSLEPCKMCAAVLVDAAAGPIAVRFVAPDPGVGARATALKALGWERPLCG